LNVTSVIASHDVRHAGVPELRGARPLQLLRRALHEEASLSTLLQKSVCHESYHAGQLGIGRRLVGKAGAIA
jgi:hypothetical protein